MSDFSPSQTLLDPQNTMVLRDSSGLFGASGQLNSLPPKCNRQTGLPCTPLGPGFNSPVLLWSCERSCQCPSPPACATPQPQLPHLHADPGGARGTQLWSGPTHPFCREKLVIPIPLTSLECPGTPRSKTNWVTRSKEDAEGLASAICG